MRYNGSSLKNCFITLYALSKNLLVPWDAIQNPVAREVSINVPSAGLRTKYLTVCPDDATTSGVKQGLLEIELLLELPPIPGVELFLSSELDELSFLSDLKFDFLPGGYNLFRSCEFCGALEEA